MDNDASSDGIAALERDVARAVAGDRAALEAVMRAVQKDIYRLALRFLWHPEDAEDATQEILIRVLTGLGGFRGDAGFRTWVYRIACNALLTLRKRRMEQSALSFDEFAEDLGYRLPASAEPPAEDRLLLEEIKIGCTSAMLLCLDRAHRLAYILGEILELDHREAAAVLDVAPAAYRQRLARARSAINTFMLVHCGLVNSANPCRCAKRVHTAIALKRLDADKLLFATSREQAERFPQVLAEIRRLDAVRRAAALYRSHTKPRPSDAFTNWLRNLLNDKADRPTR